MFIVLLRQVVYPYKIWMIGKNSNFCSHLNMEDITDADYAHAKEFVKIFK